MQTITLTKQQFDELIAKFQKVADEAYDRGVEDTKNMKKDTY